MNSDRRWANEQTRVAGMRDRFLPLDGDDTPLSPELFLRLEAERVRQPDRCAVAIIASWRREGARHHVESSVVFVDDDLPVAVSVGRHTACDISDIPGAALRHALVLLQGGSKPLVEAIDLHSGIGFYVGGPTLATRIEASAAVRFGVGSAEIIVLPSAPRTPLLPEGLQSLLQPDADMHIREQRRGDERFLGRLVEDSVAWAQRPIEISRIDALDALQARETSFFGSTLVRPAHEGSIVVEVTAEEVVEGVLLGRYPRCRKSVALSAGQRVSRVHALIIERRGQTWLADVGSTYGTVVENDGGVVKAKLSGARRVARLDEGDRVLLGDREVTLVVDGLRANVPRGHA